MNKLYIIVFSESYDRDKLTQYFDNNQWTITFWFYNLPNSVFVRSTLSAAQLYDFITKAFGQYIIIITEVTSNMKGFVPNEHLQYYKGLK